MNCEKCQELISLFLDNELDEKSSMNVQTHLAVCAECAKICEDFAMILDFCEDDLLKDSLPPNSKALWCRINNIIETEVQTEIAKETTHPETKTGWLPRSWSFSVSQVVSAVLFIALVSSLLTIVGIKNLSAEDDIQTADAQPTFLEKVFGKFGLVETPEQKHQRRLNEHQAAIDYWTKRVEMRRAQWDKHLREAFDRNLNEINQVVFEYNKILQENPDDNISKEMLDSAMNEKMDLLREFSEL